MVRTFIPSIVLMLVSFLRLNAAPPEKHDPYAPHDVILAIDVSGSMVFDWEASGPGRRPGAVFNKPSDPTGLRFDAVNLIIDSALPDDRIAIALFAGEAFVPTKVLDSSGYITIGKDHGQGRVQLKSLINDIQNHESAIRDEYKKVMENKAYSGDQKKEKTYELQAKYCYYALPSLKGNNFVIDSSTSIVGALRAIVDRDGADLIRSLTSDHEPWLFLLTDGHEEAFKDTDRNEARDNFKHQYNLAGRFLAKGLDGSLARKTRSDTDFCNRERLRRAPSAHSNCQDKSFSDWLIGEIRRKRKG